MPYNSLLDRYPAPPIGGGPASRADVVTPNDTGELAIYYEALYVGTAGDLTVTPKRNTSDTGILFQNVPVGWFPVAVRKVWATGTLATDIVGLRD